MPTKKKTKKAKPAAKPKAKKAAKSGSTKKRRSLSVPSKVRKTAIGVLAGAAAGAVRALIPPLEEAAGKTEKMAGSKGDGQQKRKSSGR